MTRLTNLIKEVLSIKPKEKEDCDCGCGGCSKPTSKGVMLNESVAPKQILSENLQYHVHNKLPLTENTFRYGSQSFINLWAEARSLYLREIIHVNDDDKEILTETDLGNYGMYEGKKVPLGLPMENTVNESEDLDWGIEKIDWKRIIDREYKEAQRIFGQAVDTKPTKEDYAAAEKYVKMKHGDKWHVEALGINKAQNKLYIQAQENLQRHLHTSSDDLLDKEYVIYRSVNESEDLDKIRKEVEKIAQNSPGKGWTKKSIDQEVNRRFQQFLNRKSMNESEDFEEEEDWDDDDNIYTGPYSYGIDKRTWDVDWKLPKDNLFNASKTIKATNNRVDAIRKMLERFPKELAKFENDTDYPAFDMNYDELIKWYKSISNFSLSEAANKGLEQKLNSELGDINGIFAQEDIDVDDAEFYNVKPGNYIKYYIEDVNNSTILKVKRIAKANGLKFAKDLDDMLLFTSTSINEAAKKKKKKDPPIGKPKRGGSKAYYVYVRDPRTKKVKKISFGSGGLKAKINNPKARKAFAARHKCKTKTDKTKAGYWSCRLPRYAKLLGLKSSFSGFW